MNSSDSSGVKVNISQWQEPTVASTCSNFPADQASKDDVIRRLNLHFERLKGSLATTSG